MPKPELGLKRQCQNCDTKFFDLSKDPILCPKCGTVFVVATAAPSAGPTRSAARAAPKRNDDDEEAETETDAETVSLEEADEEGGDGKVEAATTDEDVEVEDEDNSNDDDDTFLEEDEEDDGDVADLIDGDIEDDEER